MIPFPEGPFDLILADPPWVYNDKATAGDRGAGCKYDVMTSAEIAFLPVREIAAVNCLLAMWWVGPQPREALEVIDGWGFELINFTGFTWHKLTKTGKSAFGMGHWTRGNCENVAFARRGRPKRVDAGVSQFLEEIEYDAYVNAEIGRHSQKPLEVHRRLERLMGQCRRLELFAREAQPGWTAWGNQLAPAIAELEVEF